MAHRRPATRIGSIPRRMVGGIAAYRGPFRPSPEVRSEPQNGHAQRRQNDGNGERGEWPDGHEIGLPKFRWVTSRRGRKKERGLLVRLRNRRMNLVMRITAVGDSGRFKSVAGEFIFHDDRWGKPFPQAELCGSGQPLCTAKQFVNDCNWLQRPNCPGFLLRLRSTCPSS